MTLYLDASVLLKRYVDEPDSERFAAVTSTDETWLTCRVAWVEVWRNLGRLLPAEAATTSREAFRADWEHVAIVEVDAVLAERAGTIAEITGTRTLDALHLAALDRVGPEHVPLVTADLRQAHAARTLGWTVLTG